MGPIRKTYGLQYPQRYIIAVGSSPHTHACRKDTVGKKLFEQPYGLLRKLLKSSKVRTDLRALLRDLRT